MAVAIVGWVGHRAQRRTTACVVLAAAHHGLRCGFDSEGVAVLRRCATMYQTCVIHQAFRVWLKPPTAWPRNLDPAALLQAWPEACTLYWFAGRPPIFPPARAAFLPERSASIRLCESQVGSGFGGWGCQGFRHPRASRSTLFGDCFAARANAAPSSSCRGALPNRRGGAAV